MSIPTGLGQSDQWQTTATTHHANHTAHTRGLAQASDELDEHFKDVPLSENSSALSSVASTSPSTATSDFQDLDHYIALGCLHFNAHLPKSQGPTLEGAWAELLDLPLETKLLIGDEAARLLDARWIRLFSLQSDGHHHALHGTARVYLLPEDWNRRFIDRNSRGLKNALRRLLSSVDTSASAWAGDHQEGEVRGFDPWASAEHVSLYYLFNKLPSPAPDPAAIKSRYTRTAVRDLLKSAASSEWEEHGEQPLAGLRTRLYPYQARSASLMIQRETAPQLQLDPRLEVRTSPTGKPYYFGARDGSALLDPRYYEANRGGILAETMGYGKTIICLAVILTTKGHLPHIPAPYLSPPCKRKGGVGSLSDMAASIIGRAAIPARALIEQSEENSGADYARLKEALDRNPAYYELPLDLPRMNRNTQIPPPRRLDMCAGTIVVVPRNLLHQWQSEVQKHVLEGGLKILVVDSLPKRGHKFKPAQLEGSTMKCISELPSPAALTKYDVILFTRNRFEQEFVDSPNDLGRGGNPGISPSRNCSCNGSSRSTMCECGQTRIEYESPLRKLHWLRIIIDEGHNFSSSMSNAVLLAKQIQVERRWVVSGTPAKNLVGVELDTATLESDVTNTHALRQNAIEQRKTFSAQGTDGASAVKALGSLASNFLMVRPWCDSLAEGKLEWDNYIYRHEHQYKKTYSGFSSCFLRILEGLVIKTRPEDVEKDIVLPPMTHRVVYLKPCWYDKMTANLFVQVLRANAITSERRDVDYLFHPNSTKARHSLIRNLRQSNFTWTGFRLEDVVSTLETTEKYLGKDDKNCTSEDEMSLRQSSQAVSKLAISEEWKNLSRAHEVGMAVQHFPTESEKVFALAYPRKPTMIGITQLLEGQLHVDSHITSPDPAEGLDVVGHAAKQKMDALAEADEETKDKQGHDLGDSDAKKVSVPSSCIGDKQPLTSRRASAMLTKSSPQKVEKKQNTQDIASSASPSLPRKRKLTMAQELAHLPADSPLLRTQVVATTSAKLTYLLDKVVECQATEKIIIFYDGDNAAFYIAQCLEMLYINHRIYARTLDNVKRSEYVALFNEDPDVRVLLIDVACGALGLNLNAASVVLIVNPINRSGLEAQAIKRAHRIGQNKKVTVETLVLEGTMEHAIFSHAKKMTRAEHLEAKELEDDAGITEIIQGAQILPILPDEEEGEGMFAKLKTPQQVFGRSDRHKYHRYGNTEPKSQDRSTKKAKISGRSSQAGPGAKASKGKPHNTGDQPQTSIQSSATSQSQSQLPLIAGPQAGSTNSSQGFASIFGAGNP
ncbi:P-loop containing nucleoside triphosphate hydrolase protein [Phaeosphaeria sp. MPI-PUGE-AT-0046c]|nr:P-loop containing nucleoside triphosphate hydrolase protein [Phaeosphaeria sp. MPI-PUGE-AT-0046c]